MSREPGQNCANVAVMMCGRLNSHSDISSCDLFLSADVLQFRSVSHLQAVLCTHACMQCCVLSIIVQFCYM